MSDSIQVRPENPSDYAIITQINEQAFGRVNEARLIELIRSSPNYIPELALVADYQGTVVGYILFSWIDLVGAETDPVLGLAPLAVKPEFQKQGIGRQLVEAGLKIAETRGDRLVIVLGEPEFYSKFGFKPSVHYQIQSPFPVPEQYFQVKPLKNYRPTDQGTVVYPAAFLQV